MMMMDDETRILTGCSKVANLSNTRKIEQAGAVIADYARYLFFVGSFLFD